VVIRLKEVNFNLPLIPQNMGPKVVPRTCRLTERTRVDAISSQNAGT